MKKIFSMIVGAVFCLFPSAARNFHHVISPVDYVNPLVGSLSKNTYSNGNTYPAIALPWGMNFWTPQTGTMGDGWTYRYDADKIVGLKQTHQPSPWINDYGQFSIMPVTTAPVFRENERASWFSHKAETATPFYYSVYLADHDVLAELAPTERCAAVRLTYPEKEISYLVVDAFDNGSYVKIIPEEKKIIGYTTKNSTGVPENFRNWFVIISDTEFEFTKAVSDANLTDQLEAQSNHSGAIVGFKTHENQQVNLKIASSFISLEQAELNLREIGTRDFDEVKSAGKARWNDVLGRIKVEDNNVDRLRTFYSCLYRSVLFPRNLSEINAKGEQVHYSPFNGNICAGPMFTDTGFWDTFRCLFPLLNLVYPEMNREMQAGLVNTYNESGFLPEWASPGHRGCMVGNNSASVVADAYLKGLRGYDIEKLWEAVVKGANSVHPQISSTGRLGWEEYNNLGYVPSDIGVRESAARTLEYAYDDWCIYKLGQALGKTESELEPFRKNSMNYRNLFSKEDGLMRGRCANGDFVADFNPFKWGGDFTEGNSYHYTWSVFHDPVGLMNLMGGQKEFLFALDRIFQMPPIFDDSYYGSTIHEIREMQVMNMGNYAHGNQPIQHMLYLYDWTAEPWKAQFHIREVMDKLYSATPDGYCGDEDNGQTSAWYVFSAMGFYPVCPGSGQYAVGTPLFDKVTVELPGKCKIEINARNNAEDHPYIQSLRVNGRKSDKNYIEHDVLVKGARLDFEMSSEPNKERGIKDNSRPYSFSIDE